MYFSFSSRLVRHLCVVIVALLILSSCMNPVSPNVGKKGKIVITINQTLSTVKSLLPGLDMTPASYVISGQGPQNATFSTTTNGNSTTISDLIKGDWSITVEAYNGDPTPTLIGTGSATTTVVAGAIGNVSITVVPLSGYGTLSLSLIWPANVLTTPVIEAQLTSTQGGTPQTLNFAISGNSASYTSSTVPTGYYTLSVTLKNESMDIGGKTDIVRIIKGQVTSGTYDFTTAVNNAPGRLISTITPALADPFEVSIAGGRAAMLAGTTLNLTATVTNTNPSEELHYAWYVNGVDQRVNTSTWSGGSDWTRGYHQIDLTAISSDGKRAGSGSVGVGVCTLFAGAVQGNMLSLSGEETVFAGSGNYGYKDGVGTAAEFRGPFGITTDGTNLYVADNANNRIRKIVIATGEVSTLAGSGDYGYKDGVGTAAEFRGPIGITTDGTNLYVADASNNMIRKVAIATGEVSSFAGSGDYGYADGTGSVAKFRQPWGVTTDGTNLYIADTGNNRIRKIVIATGEVSTFAGSGDPICKDGIGLGAGIPEPGDLITDGINLYLADSNNSAVRKIAIDTGKVSTMVSSIVSPIGITTDGTSIYVTKASSAQERLYEINITTKSVIERNASIIARGLTTDGVNLYATDPDNSRVYQIR